MLIEKNRGDKCVERDDKFVENNERIKEIWRFWDSSGKEEDNKNNPSALRLACRDE